MRTRFFVLLEGTAAIRIADESGDVQIGSIEAGASVGELGLLLDAKRAASVVALSALQTLKYSRDALDALSRDIPELGLSLKRAVSRLAQISGHVTLMEPETQTPTREISTRGLRPVSADELNASLRLALKSMSAVLQGESTADLTEAEQSVLRSGGLVLEEQPGPDPLAEMTVQFAALIETSLSINEVSQRLGFSAGRIRQMVAGRTLYSILLDNRRYVPIFQFAGRGQRLVPNIGKVNAALSPELHPVEVFEWYTTPNPDLILDDDTDRTISPLDWLNAGNPPAPVERLAKTL